ncbi:glycosyltransferase family 4 protein [Burkholderia sp. MR1-5-21]
MSKVDHGPVRIALVANTTWSIYTYRLGLVSMLLENGAEVVVMAPHDDTVATLESMGCRHLPLRISPKGTNPINDLRTMQQLRLYYEDLRPHLVFHYTIKPNIYGSIAAKLVGVPSVAVTTGLGHVFTKLSPAALIAKVLYRVAFRFPEEVWFLNEDDLRTFKAARLLARPERGRVLYGEGVNLAHFDADPLPKRDTFTFILVARMLWDKGVKEFVNAARILRWRYPYARFQLLGPLGVDNPSAIAKADIDKWTDEGLVEYLGQVKDVRARIEAADCVVLPSFYREGVPRSLMEASAMRRPIITTDNTGCREVVEDGVTGYLCRPRDSMSLAVKMVDLLDLGHSARREMGRRGRDRMSQRFNEERVVDVYRSAISSLTGVTLTRSRAESSDLSDRIATTGRGAK